MATKKNTEVVAEVAEPTVIAISKPAKVTESEKATVNRESAEALVVLFDDNATVFERAQASYHAWMRGGSFRDIAPIMSQIAAKSARPDASAEVILALSEKSQKEGGYLFPFQKMANYAKAWADVVDATVPTTDATVRRSFTLVSTSNTADGRKALREEIVGNPDMTDAQKISAFLEGADAILVAVRDAKINAEDKSEDKVPAEDKALATLEEAMSSDLVDKLIAAITGHDWSEAEAEAIAEKLTEAAIVVSSKSVDALV